MTIPESIPKPLVRWNQTFILTLIILSVVVNIQLLWIPFAMGLITVITKFNPVIAVGKSFLKKPASSYIPEEKAQQIFNQWIATICFGLALAFFYLDWTVASYIAVAMVTIATALALFFDFCLGCTVRYQYQMWKHRRKQKQA